MIQEEACGCSEKCGYCLSAGISEWYQLVVVKVNLELLHTRSCRCGWLLMTYFAPPQFFRRSAWEKLSAMVCWPDRLEIVSMLSKC